MRLLQTTIAATLILTLAGCYGSQQAPKPPTAPPAQVTAGPVVPAETPKDDAAAKEEAAIKEELAKLSPEDRKLVDAQEWCVINSDDRLGAMGAPVKIMVKETPVFLCCKSCEKDAKANPDKTLAKLEELKAKKKAAADKK